MSELKRLRLPVVVAVCMALIDGCHKNPSSPGIQPEITNITDNFQYQVTDIQNYSHTDTYVWQNTGAAAKVNQATIVTGGIATLVLLDDVGVEVYRRSLAENGTYIGAEGVPGSWTIRVIYSSVDATVNFRVQKSI